MLRTWSSGRCFRPCEHRGDLLARSARCGCGGRLPIACGGPREQRPCHSRRPPARWNRACPGWAWSKHKNTTVWGTRRPHQGRRHPQGAGLENSSRDAGMEPRNGLRVAAWQCVQCATEKSNGFDIRHSSGNVDPAHRGEAREACPGVHYICLRLRRGGGGRYVEVHTPAKERHAYLGLQSGGGQELHIGPVIGYGERCRFRP